MTRDEVKNYILNEAKRLEEEEHVTELAKNGQFEKLKQVEVRTKTTISEFLRKYDLDLGPSEIPAGLITGLVIWKFCCANDHADDEFFPLDLEDEIYERLASEAGDMGKSICVHVRAYMDGISNLSIDEFFNDDEAMNY